MAELGGVPKDSHQTRTRRPPPPPVSHSDATAGPHPQPAHRVLDELAKQDPAIRFLSSSFYLAIGPLVK